MGVGELQLEMFNFVCLSYVAQLGFELATYASTVRCATNFALEPATYFILF